MKANLPIDVRVARSIVRAKIAILRAYSTVLGPLGGARFIVSRVDWGDIRPNEPNVLCLYRPLFSKDLEQLRNRTRVNWIYINNEFVGHVQSAWIPKEIGLQTDYQKYKGVRYKKYWEKAERFGVEVLRKIEEKVSIDAILTSHIDYWHAEGIRLAAKKFKIPFLALCREHMCLPIEQQTVAEYYRGFRFEGDAVAVFGEATRRIFINSGACDPDQVVVTGPPRLDAWRDTPERIDPRNYIVLLSYRDPDYRAPNSFREVLQVFRNMAICNRGHSDVIFLVKAKNREDEQEIRGLVGEVPENLRIDHDVPLQEIFPRSRMVIGFNSLALVEAHFTTARIVVPYWGDARRSSDELMFDYNHSGIRKVISFAESREDLEDLIRRSMDDGLKTISREVRMEGVRRIFSFPEDGTCSKEVENFIRDHIERITL